MIQSKSFDALFELYCSMIRELLDLSISAIDSLLETVPQDVMDDVIGKEAPRPVEAS